MADALDRLTAALTDRYRIERELGSGGMATVYLAHDLKHDRQVAVKVLRPELAAVIGADRFLAEIRTTANLQHPHILPLFDSGQADSFLFYVMPFIDGESLRDRLNHEKQMPIPDAVRITTEVAAALDYAHRHGVIHRDIKPENILLHDGRALVADFGIALAASKAGARMTETGMSLGTPQYMSPEQAMGERTLTARSDVYALGCVLYEMLVGQPPFTGATAQAIFAKVMTEKPAPIIPQRDTVPEQVEDAILTALAKVPADRFATATEFAAALVTGPVTALSGGRPGAAQTSKWKTIVKWGVVGAALVAIAFMLFGRPEPSAPMIRTRLTFETSQAPVGGPGKLSFLLMPTGDRVVYEGPGKSGGQLWTQSLLDQLEPPTPIPSTDGPGYNFALSPTGGAVAFWQDSKLRKVPLNGGSIITLADSISPSVSLAWLDDGRIIYKANQFGEIAFRSVSASGGVSRPVPVQITGTLSGLVVIVGALPHSRGLILVTCPPPASICGPRGEVWILDLQSHEARRLLNANGAWYVAPGFLVSVSPSGVLYAQPFSLRTLDLTGPPVPVLEGVQMGLDGSWDMAGSRDGTLLYRPGGPSAWREQLVWVRRDGTESPVDSNWSVMSNDFRGWARSPNDSQVALSILSEDGSQGVWVKQLSRGPLLRLTINSSTSIRPRWTPDGRSVTFVALEKSDSVLRVRRSDGTGGDSVLLRWRGPVWEGFETRDWVVARVVGLRGDTEIVGRRIGRDTGVVKLVSDSGYDVTSPMLSPDGKWLAYKSNETQRDEVYIRPFPRTDSTKILISINGGTSPLWAHSGRELYYVNLEGEMMVVAVTPGAPQRHDRPRVLFRLGKDLVHGTDSYYTWFDVSRDDQRFLMARGTSTGQEGVVTLVLVRNWLNLIKAKLRAQ